MRFALRMLKSGMEHRKRVFRKLGFYDTEARDSYMTDDGRALEDVIMRWDMRF